jgi:uncharacterized membrane protein
MLDQVLQYSIPILHPVVVHFPVALAVVAVLFAAGWLIRNQIFWLHVTIWLHVLAGIGAIFALRTGEAMEEQSEGIAIVDELVHLHETMAERAAWLLGFCIVWLIIAAWLSRRDTSRSGTRLWIRLATFVFVLAVALLFGLTGHIGGLMTWGIPA